ncbi:hypothetical protein GOODEAATRI_028317, partial [Goodea atripinnis]
MSSLGSPSDPCLSPLAWSVAGKNLASAMEKMVNIWQVNGGKGLLDVQPHWVSALAWPEEEVESLRCGEPKDLLLVLAGAACKVFDIPPWLTVWPGVTCQDAVRSPSTCSPYPHFHEIKLLFFSCCQNGLISVWTVPQEICDFPESRVSGSERLWETEAKPKILVNLLCCINRWCIKCHLRSSIKIISMDGAMCVFQLKGHITPVRTLAFSPDGLALASGGVGGLMNIWSLQDVLVVNCSKEFMASNHVLATCRTALKKQGVVGLNMAPCMRAFLERLPVMLQEQYTYEKVLELGRPHVVCGEQLVHSPYMQCLASMAVGLHLDQLLCSPPAPPHLRHCPPESGTAVWNTSEWAWLNCFSTTIKAAEALARGATFPDSFCVPDLEQGPKEEMALVMDNGKWASGMDEQIMSWATSRPEVNPDPSPGIFCCSTGRHGQLAEAGRNILVPTTAPSFSQAQQ